MNPEDLSVTIDEILNKDGLIHHRATQEKTLFKQSILLQQEELHRTPSTMQVMKAWQRWKRERHLEVGAEPGDFGSLHKGAK